MSNVVDIWTDIIKQYPPTGTILLMDSYYMDNTAKDHLDKNGIRYLASFNANRFKDVQEYLTPKVRQKGDWAGIFDPIHNHAIIYHWHVNDKIHKKWVMGNACTKTRSRAKSDIVPLFTLYGKNFSTCDHFNRSLHQRTWPHRKGGYQRSGAQGAQHNFIFSCILINTFNAFHDINRHPSENFDFQADCVALADQIFIYLVKNH